MSGSIFFETLRRRKWTILYWVIGVALLALYVVLLLPNVQAITSYATLVKSLPPVVMSMFGTDATALATPAGFLGYAVFGYMVLVLAAYGVIYGLDITANDEERGQMDVILSLPIPRWRVVLEKYLAYAVGVILIALVTLIVVLAGVAQSPSLASISNGAVIAACLNFIPATLFVMAFTALLAVIVRRRGLATGIAALFVVASWLIDTIGRAAPSADWLRSLSFVRYYDGANVIVNGAVPANLLGLMGVALICLIGTVWFFNRRDVGV